MSSSREQISLYASDSISLGFRSREAAKKLIGGGYVKPAYGRKGHVGTALPNKQASGFGARLSRSVWQHAAVWFFSEGPGVAAQCSEFLW